MGSLQTRNDRTWLPQGHPNKGVLAHAYVRYRLYLWSTSALLKHFHGLTKSQMVLNLTVAWWGWVAARDVREHSFALFEETTESALEKPFLRLLVSLPRAPANVM